jgi:NADH:ubiquinone oxidoreductase subunit E
MTMMTFLVIASLLLLPYAAAFMGQNVRVNHRITCVVRSSETNAEHETTPVMIDSEISSKFKILTCSSTSCAKKREMCGLDSFATYGAFYNRIKEAFPDVQLEESPCLGSCKQAPCVAIEHDDFVGTVALEGMSGNEFSDRV